MFLRWLQVVVEILEVVVDPCELNSQFSGNS